MITLPRKRRSMMIVLCLATIAAPAVAGIGEGNGELGFDFGVTDFDDEVSRDDGSRFVVRGGYFVTDLIELEGQLAGSVTDEAIGDVALSTVMFNVVFNFRPRDNIVPYALAGIGRAVLEVDFVFAPVVDDASVAYQIGGGSRFFFGKRKKVAFRVDLSALREDTFGESSTHTHFVLGFTWRLGQGTVPSP